MSLLSRKQKMAQQQQNNSLVNNEISIGWQELQYEVVDFSLKFNLNKKSLLRGLNGHFKYGSLNGLMGPSGSGKTTLLNCLSEIRQTTKRSKIFTNIAAQSSSFSVLSCFVEQHAHESVFGKMSVGDLLQYAFRLKNSTTKTNRATMKKHIDKIMCQLMLPNDLLIQNFENCSGGQQKRIAIGQELMSLEMPVFLFVDEPTTGLDSLSAFEVINCLKQLALDNQITVIVSIHAPNNETLNMLDQIYVLAKSGVAIYSGPPSGVQSYLKIEIQLEIPARQPPIEALIKIACNGIDDPNVIKLAQKCSKYELDQLSCAIQSEVKNKLTHNGIPSIRKSFYIYDLYYNFCRQFQITFVANWSTFLIVHFLLTFFILFTSTFYDYKIAIPSGCVGLKHQAENSSISCLVELNEGALIRENITFFWYMTLLATYFTCCSSAIFVGPFVKIFQKEHRNNWYSLGVSYLSITLTSLIEVTLQTFLLVITCYFASHQYASDGEHFNWYRLGLCLGIFWLINVYRVAQKYQDVLIFNLFRP